MMRYKSIGRHRRPHLRKLLLREKTTKLGIALVSHCSGHHHHHIGSDKGRVTVPKGSKAAWNFSEKMMCFGGSIRPLMVLDRKNRRYLAFGVRNWLK